jgi:hypothetical protein
LVVSTSLSPLLLSSSSSSTLRHCAKIQPLFFCYTIAVYPLHTPTSLSKRPRRYFFRPLSIPLLPFCFVFPYPLRLHVSKLFCSSCFVPVIHFLLSLSISLSLAVVSDDRRPFFTHSPSLIPTHSLACLLRVPLPILCYHPLSALLFSVSVSPLVFPLPTAITTFFPSYTPSLHANLAGPYFYSLAALRSAIPPTAFLLPSRSFFNASCFLQKQVAVSAP